MGISGDAVSNLELFKKVHNLNFPLLSDEEGVIAKKFGVLLKPGGTFKTKDDQGKEVELKRGVTAMRWTFVIGKDGKIIYKNDKVTDPAKDRQQILSALEKQEK